MSCTRADVKFDSSDEWFTHEVGSRWVTLAYTVQYLLVSIHYLLTITHENYLMFYTHVLQNNMQVMFEICQGMQEHMSVFVNLTVSCTIIQFNFRWTLCITLHKITIVLHYTTYITFLTHTICTYVRTYAVEIHNYYVQYAHNTHLVS